MNRALLLWAEDDPGDRAMIRRTLQRSSLDLKLVMAMDGKEAMDFISGSGSRPRVEPTIVILDLEMPRMSGWDLLTAIRALPGCEDLPLVVFSSSGMPSDIGKALKRGATDYLIKPLEPLRFREMVLDLGQRCVRYASSDAPLLW